jgi:hypothetical protein
MFNSGVTFCFCGKGIEEEYPLIINLDFPDENFQTMYAHGQCFRDRLHSSVPFLTPQEHLDD